MSAIQGTAVVNSSLPQSAVAGFHSGSVLAAADDDAQVWIKILIMDSLNSINQYNLLSDLMCHL